MMGKDKITDIIQQPAMFGDKLRKLRQIREFTIEKASELSGLSVSYISLIESGKRNIKFESLRSLLKSYDYSVSYFISCVQDEIAEKTFDPGAFVQTTAHSLLLSGERGPDCFSFQLLRPLRSPQDSGIYYLQMPPKFDMTRSYMTLPLAIRGVVLKGKLLVSFHDDEFTASEGEEFAFDGNRPHILRNYSGVVSASYLFLEQGAY